MKLQFSVTVMLLITYASILRSELLVVACTSAVVGSLWPMGLIRPARPPHLAYKAISAKPCPCSTPDAIYDVGCGAGKDLLPAQKWLAGTAD